MIISYSGPLILRIGIRRMSVPENQKETNISLGAVTHPNTAGSELLQLAVV